MNKKGFTLIELLGVITILGLLVVIVFTNGFGLFNKTKKEINEIEEDNLLEAARVLLVDIDNKFVQPSLSCTSSYCSNDSLINSRDFCKCSSYSNTYLVKVKYLINNNYFKDADEHCNKNASLKISITKDSNNQTLDYTVKKATNAVICENK